MRKVINVEPTHAPLLDKATMHKRSQSFRETRKLFRHKPEYYHMTPSSFIAHWCTPSVAHAKKIPSGQRFTRAKI